MYVDIAHTELSLYYDVDLYGDGFEVYRGNYVVDDDDDVYTYQSGAVWIGGVSEETGDDWRHITITSIDETQSAYEDFKTWLIANATKIS